MYIVYGSNLLVGGKGEIKEKENQKGTPSKVTTIFIALITISRLPPEKEFEVRDGLTGISLFW